MRSSSYVYLASQPALEAGQLGTQRVVIHGLVAQGSISQKLLVPPGHGCWGVLGQQGTRPKSPGGFHLTAFLRVLKQLP